MIAALLLAAASPVAAPVRIAQEAPAVEIWQVDQLQLPPDTPEAKLKALEPDHSMDAVIARLKTLGLTFTRARVGMVPSRMPPKMREQLSGLPDGEPFVLPGEEYITVNVIIGRHLPPGTVRFVPSGRGDPSGVMA